LANRSLALGNKIGKILPKLEPSYSLHLPVIRAMEVTLCGPDMRVAHQILDGLVVDPFIQQGSGKGMLQYVGMDSLPDQGPLGCYLNQAVDRLWCLAGLLEGARLTQSSTMRWPVITGVETNKRRGA
jgi:hypothetical protein